MESQTTTNGPSMLLMQLLGFPKRIRGKFKIDCEICPHLITLVASTKAKQGLVCYPLAKFSSCNHSVGVDGSEVQQVVPPVTLEVSHHDKNDKSMCVFGRLIPLPLTSHCSSTKRLPFSIRTASHPLRPAIPSNYTDLSASRVRPSPRHSAHDNGRGEESVDRHETKPERYEIVKFKPTMAGIWLTSF
jgi:hypothetical protein